jgi:hypothetical protein
MPMILAVRWFLSDHKERRGIDSVAAGDLRRRIRIKKFGDVMVSLMSLVEKQLGRFVIFHPSDLSACRETE